MTKPIDRISGRKLKKAVIQALSQNRCDDAVEGIGRFPLKQVVNPLFGLFHHADETIRWRAITAMGEVVDRLAGKELESARVVMRRLIWNLNDESGGIGWGSPEAMGEIMARNRVLAEEYHFLLLSYIDPDGNFIEYEMLQRGVLWGLGRLADARPELIDLEPALLTPYLQAPDAHLRALAAWVAGAFKIPDAMHPLLESLASDTAAVKLFINRELVQISVGRLAALALSDSGKAST